MIPASTQALIDSSPEGIFSLLNADGLLEVPLTELASAFKNLKQILDAKSLDYKVALFDLVDEGKETAQTEEEREASEIRLAYS